MTCIDGSISGSHCDSSNEVNFYSMSKKTRSHKNGNKEIFFNRWLPRTKHTLLWRNMKITYRDVRYGENHAAL